MTELLSAVAKIRDKEISEQQQQIRNFFQPLKSPYYFISYADFCKNFQVHAGKNFKQQNLYIIDTHLKYRQWIYEQMAPYKWTPIILVSVFNLLRLRRPPLIIPFIYTKMFDHYMEPFFCWLHQDQKVINMRYEFATKLSKVKNKERRVRLWKSLQKSFKREDQVKSEQKKQPQAPDKYLKFGFPTQYVFHGQTDSIQMSTVLQTKLFQTYMNFRYPSLNSLNQLLSTFLNLKSKFLEYKNDPDRKKNFINIKQFMIFKDIKKNERYLLSTCIQKRIRRWLQILMYERKQTIYFSNFTLDNILYLYEHKHMTEEPKYNIEQNTADLCIYYAMILIPTVFLKFFRR